MELVQTDYEFHPAAALFPLLSIESNEFAELVSDISGQGLVEPIRLYEDQILDGRNRYRACQHAGVEPRFEEWRGENPIAYVLSVNLFRRHLDPDQRAAIAAEALPMLEEEAKKRADDARRELRGGYAEPSGADSPPKVSHPSRQQAAEQFQVSTYKVRQAQEVKQKAPELHEQVKAGIVPLREAHNHTVHRDSEAVTPKSRPAVTLEDWKTASEVDRTAWLQPPPSTIQFNRQDTTSIEWAMWSWNPVTGCLHNCPYCYARDIAERFYPEGFAPVLHPDRLLAPGRTQKPSRAGTEPGWGNVFTCSMADLFGRWVPTEWITAVLDQVRGNSQWNFLFLTKFPVRLSEFEFPDNAWVGTTVDCQVRVKNAERCFRKVQAKVKWLSVEPMLEPLHFEDLGAFQWVVLGGASRSNQTPEWHPPRDWVLDLERRAEEAGCIVYEKSNLWDRYRDFPGRPATNRRPELPAALRYLPTVEAS